jgi:Tfp pilus assembly PilM family ATPase
LNRSRRAVVEKNISDVEGVGEAIKRLTVQRQLKLSAVRSPFCRHYGTIEMDSSLSDDELESDHRRG